MIWLVALAMKAPLCPQTVHPAIRRVQNGALQSQDSELVRSKSNPMPVASHSQIPTSYAQPRYEVSLTKDLCLAF